jgi:cytoskeletal protein CcmA (bactofilin family)
VGVFSKSASEREDKGRNGGRADVDPHAKAASGKTSPETVSTLGHAVLVTGNIVSEGTLQIFGRVDGDIHASHLVIKEGGQVEGNVVAQETTILGRCKGTIRSNSVKLEGSAVVDGEIYSKSLSIEQEAQFEGVSRRLTTPVDAPSSDRATVPAKIPAKIALAPAMAETAPTGAAVETINA